MTEVKGPRSLRVDVEALVVPIEESEYAAGFNAALRQTLAIIERHEEFRKKRSARAIKQRKKDGKRLGGDLPYGYELDDDGETLRESLEEQEVIAAARKLRADGHSLRDVASRLKDRGMFPREGKLFHAAQIKRITDENP